MSPRLFIAAAAVAALTATAASADTHSDKSCFRGRDWQNWTAPGDGDVILLRVNLHDIYRIELTPGSHVRKDADRFLITKERGTDWICGPLDLDLQLSDHSGFREPLIARSLRKLTPAEVAAIPPRDRP